MYKLLPIFLFAFCFAETVEVYYTTETPIAGFQFNVDGVSVTNTSSGDAEKYNFMISANETTVVGFSLTSTTIPSGNGILLLLDIDGNTDDVCLTDVIISNSNGDALGTRVEDCNSINISGSGLDKFSFSNDTWDGDACNMAINSIHVTTSGTVLYNIDTPIAGVQFNVDGATVLNTSGGEVDAQDFMISSNETTVLSFSLTGATFDGCGTMIELELDGVATGLSGIIISGDDGGDIPFTYFNAEVVELVCIDNDAAMAPFDCYSAVSEYGCDMFWNDVVIRDVCPVSCDICPKAKQTQALMDFDSSDDPLLSDDMKNEFYNTSWAVIIGINEYENIRPLRFAVQDAKEIRNLLITEFGFPKENVRILIDNEATLNNIRDDLYEIANMANEDDRILVYFAGHGETKSLKSGVEKGYLIPTDGNVDKISSTCLPMTEIKDIGNETVAKHILFLMDACFSGLAAVDTRGINRSTPGYIEKIVRDYARQIITAGGKNEEVIEKDEWGHSAFAKNLIQGLKSAIADQDYDGYITADELGSFLQKRVYIDSEAQQMPLKARFGSGEGEFIFQAKKIIENIIIDIIPNNIYEKDGISSEEVNNLIQRVINDFSYLLGDKAATNYLRDLHRLIKERDQTFKFIYGCTDENAINFNPHANIDDESCIILDSDDVYIRFGDFHRSDSTLDIFFVSNRRIYNMEILTQGFKIVDVINGNLDLDNIKTIAIADEILRRGWLGVAVQDIDKNLAEALSLNSQRGVIILNDSPEDNAGLKEKDVIILIDNEKVYDMLQFKHLMSKAYANDIKEFTIIRSGKEMNVTATINALPVEDQNIDYEQIFISYEDSLNGFFIPKEMTLLFKVKVLPIDDSFCFTGLTINEHDTSNIKLGECKTGLMMQEVALTDTSEVEILSGEHAAETGTILQETDEGKYDILLKDSTIVEGVDPSQVNRLEEQVYSGNYLYIKNVDYRKKMIDIYYQTDDVIAGFQFEVSGIEITGASGGAAEEAGFMLSSNSTTVIGFSLSGSTFDGEGQLLQLEYFADKTARDNDDAVAPFDCASAVASFGCDYNWGGTSISNSCPESCSFLGLSTICIESIVVSDPNGQAIDTHSGECWIP